MTLLRAAVPLVVLIVAGALWLITDRLLYVGPLDRATFGWFVVVPTWAAAPLVVGFDWRMVERRARTLQRSHVACRSGP